MVSKQTGIVPDFTNKFGLLKDLSTNDGMKKPKDTTTLENGQLAIEMPKIAT